ncbi:hypothetical protein MKX01_031495 [Papaver californicum]|nr:hypothetical protein MKX01_031495 [Papaver californicum]
MFLQRLLVVQLSCCWFILAAASVAAFGEAKPGCQSKCGNISIPYPFGITRGGMDETHGEEGYSIQGIAYGNHSYNINCDTSYDPPRPFLGTGDVEVISISETEIRIKNNMIAQRCYNVSGDLLLDKPVIEYGNLVTPFAYTLSSADATFRYSEGYNEGYNLLEAQLYNECKTSCDSREKVQERACNGHGCCNNTIFEGTKRFNTSMDQTEGTTSAAFLSFSPCTYAFVGEYEQFTFNASDLLQVPKYIPVVLDWAIRNKTCVEAQKDPTFACLDNSLCINLDYIPGYRCTCSKGYKGNPYLSPGCQGMCYWFSSLVYYCSWIYLIAKKRNLIKMKEKFFQKNGAKTSNIFTENELKLATNNYDESLILGQGGFGTVYKGTLSDNRTVAVKKSKIVDQSQVEQFINEVVILSQLNHQNVVKLLGCCLETEVPLLVYQYVSNGTLSQHIHSSNGVPSISWESRLRIAVETSSAHAYLHSAAYIPIVHRDVKSANILLDENCTAKVADFGASRLIPFDQTVLSTVVQGTIGYLDPEYCTTNQLTEKSGVYSFGVVLLELLTAKLPIYSEKSGEIRNLAMHFISSMEEGYPFQLLEAQVVNDGSQNKCLNFKSEKRPTMKQVTIELESLRRLETAGARWGDLQPNHETDKGLLSEPKHLSSAPVFSFDTIDSEKYYSSDDEQPMFVV